MTTQPLATSMPATTTHPQGIPTENPDGGVNEVLATLGHEMRNPLSALGNALDLWSMGEFEPDEAAKIRGIMQRQVRQLTRLSEELLDASKVATGKLKLRLQLVDLQQVIEEACEEVRPYIDECGHSISVSFSHKPLTIVVDASRMVQVFANLIQNAAKFTRSGGDLRVTAGLEYGMAVVRVRDNGAGLEPRQLPEIFAAFAQIEDTRAANNGIGIGLKLVKTIVELHGGVVTACSDGLGRGSEFTVQLPLANLRTGADCLPGASSNDLRSHSLEMV